MQLQLEYWGGKLLFQVTFLKGSGPVFQPSFFKGYVIMVDGLSLSNLFFALVGHENDEMDHDPSLTLVDLRIIFCCSL